MVVALIGFVNSGGEMVITTNKCIGDELRDRESMG